MKNPLTVFHRFQTRKKLPAPSACKRIRLGALSPLQKLIESFDEGLYSLLSCLVQKVSVYMRIYFVSWQRTDNTASLKKYGFAQRASMAIFLVPTLIPTICLCFLTSVGLFLRMSPLINFLAFDEDWEWAFFDIWLVSGYLDLESIDGWVPFVQVELATELLGQFERLAATSGRRTCRSAFVLCAGPLPM